MKVVIFVNGHMNSSQKIHKECVAANLIIAADGGANTAYRENIIPNYIIGDMDSIDEKTLKYFKEQGSNIEKYSSEKDYIDTELCLNKAIELGADTVVYIGAIGSRLDHNLGNLHLLYKTIKKGVYSYIISETADVYICEDSIEIEGNIGDTISIVPLLQDIEGITLKGFKYPLNNASFEFGDVFGVCNVLESEKAYIEIKKGCLAVIKQINI